MDSSQEAPTKKSRVSLVRLRFQSPSKSVQAARFHRKRNSVPYAAPLSFTGPLGHCILHLTRSRRCVRQILLGHCIFQDMMPPVKVAVKLSLTRYDRIAITHPGADRSSPRLEAGLARLLASWSVALKEISRTWESGKGTYGLFAIPRIVNWSIITRPVAPNIPIATVPRRVRPGTGISTLCRVQFESRRHGPTPALRMDPRFSS